MAGILSFGAYLPRWRMPSGAGERTVANWDEDPVTMAVAAARDCLGDFDRAAIDAVYVASTTLPYREKLAAAIVAEALDLPRGIRSADITGSLRSGAAALGAAADAVDAGSARAVLVAASDLRVAEPGSSLERWIGDGAAAFLIGPQEQSLAVLEHRAACSEDFIDVWRTEGDRFVRSWEDRFVVQEGYLRCMREVLGALLRASGRGAGDVARAALWAPEPRAHATLARQVGFSERSLVDPLFGRVGNCGTAFAPLLLAAALESAEPGQTLLCAAYGDGAEAMLFRTTDRIRSRGGRRGVAWHLDRRAELPDRELYRRFRGLLVEARDPRAGAGVSATVHYRERDMDIRLHAHRCRRCGTEQFPFQRTCYTCYATDDFEQVPLAERTGRVLSYTFDAFAGSPDPPLIVTTVEAEGGARLYLQMTDARPEEVDLDLPVEFVFRRVHQYGGRPNYFWKCTPVR